MASNTAKDNSHPPPDEQAKANGTTDHPTLKVSLKYKPNTSPDPTTGTQCSLSILGASLHNPISTSPPKTTRTHTTTTPTTLKTHIHTHLHHATHTELTIQLRTHLLTRAARRVLAFWRRHLPSSPPLQRLADANELLDEAQDWVVRSAVDEEGVVRGGLREKVEASYEAGKGGKFEIFEAVVVVIMRRRIEEGGGREDEWEELWAWGESVVSRVLGDDGAFGAWVQVLKGAYEMKLKHEAERQGVEWLAGEELGKLESTEEVQSILKELGVKVEVEARKQLRWEGIFGKIDAENEKMRKVEERVRKERRREEGEGKKEKIRGRKRRSSDDMASAGFRGAFVR